MHKTAKGLVALAGCRLADETHGKVADFLTCVFDELSDLDRGLIRTVQGGRNLMMYDNPKQVHPLLTGQAYNLATRLLDASIMANPGR
jgi:hypothetical protein